jgi:hypothetical protein
MKEYLLWSDRWSSWPVTLISAEAPIANSRAENRTSRADYKRRPLRGSCAARILALLEIQTGGFTQASAT